MHRVHTSKSFRKNGGEGVSAANCSGQREISSSGETKAWTEDRCRRGLAPRALTDLFFIRDRSCCPPGLPPGPLGAWTNTSADTLVQFQATPGPGAFPRSPKLCNPEARGPRHHDARARLAGYSGADRQVSLKWRASAGRGRPCLFNSPNLH